MIDPMRRVLLKWRSLRAYRDATRLYNDERWDDAIAVLNRVVVPEAYVLKAILQRAKTLHRANRFEEASEAYADFLFRVTGSSAMRAQDLAYLSAYAEFYQGKILQALGHSSATPVPKEEHICLAATASYLTRAEFLPVE